MGTDIHKTSLTSTVIGSENTAVIITRNHENVMGTDNNRERLLMHST